MRPKFVTLCFTYFFRFHGISNTTKYLLDFRTNINRYNTRTQKITANYADENEKAGRLGLR